MILSSVQTAADSAPIPGWLVIVAICAFAFVVVPFFWGAFVRAGQGAEDGEQ